MPACKNIADGRWWLAGLFSLVFVVGCGERNGTFGFELKALQSRVAGQRLVVELEQKISLSPDARSALENGVPLQIAVQLELETADETITASRRFEIRYMPLSDHYQLSSGLSANSRTFPRLRHALAELSEVELVLPLLDVPNGEYQLKARSWLDKSRLPAPMRLPAWFSPNWRHDSGWQTWPVSIRSDDPPPGGATPGITTRGMLAPA